MDIYHVIAFPQIKWKAIKVKPMNFIRIER